MSQPPRHLDYGSPAAPRAARRPVRAIVLCFLIPLPVAVAFLLFIRLHRMAPAVPPASGLAAVADFRRGNTDGDFHVSAQGTVVAGRPVFTLVHVMFYRPGGRGLDVDPATMTFTPFDSSGNATPITQAALLAYFAANGCNPANPGTVELADALFADLQNVAAGTVPSAHLRITPYRARPADNDLTGPALVVCAWLALSGFAAAVVTMAHRARGSRSTEAPGGEEGGSRP